MIQIWLEQNTNIPVILYWIQPCYLCDRQQVKAPNAGLIQSLYCNTLAKVHQIDKALIWCHTGLRLGSLIYRHTAVSGKGYYWICGMYLLCSPAAAGPVPGCYRLRLAEAGSGLPGWTVEVQLANPQPLLPRHPASPTLSLASATLCQSHCLAGGDKQVEKALKLNWQVPWQGKHRNVTQNSTWIKMSCFF